MPADPAPPVALAERVERSPDRPARNPGGMECVRCGVIFIGEEWHDLCARCLEPSAAALRARAGDG